MKYSLSILFVLTHSYFAISQVIQQVNNVDRIPVIVQQGFMIIVTKTDTLFNVESYYESGKLRSKVHFKDEALTILEGSAKYYYENGNLDAEGNFSSNKRNGEWIFFFNTGLPSGRIFFKDGKIDTSDKMAAERKVSKRAPSYTSGDRHPSFRGGKAALAMYIREKFKPLQKSLGRDKIGGVMKIGFVVSEKGKVTDVQVLSGINGKIDKKAVKRISAMPNWKPGMRLNIPVRVPLILPIVF